MRRPSRWRSVGPPAPGLLDRPWRLAACCLAVLFALTSAWSLATPLSASPDEPAQIARAAALVRGQPVGATVGSSANAFTGLQVPAVYALGAGRYTNCFIQKPTVPASCAPPYTTSTRPVRTSTYVGRYPPLYFAVVGLPSLVVVSPTGIYLMRLLSGLLSDALLTLAVVMVACWSRRRLLLVGMAVAATPMALFLAAMVNPNGFEIAAGICLWCTGIVLVLEHAEAPPPGLVAATAVAAGCLMLARGLSPFWVACIAVVLAVLGGMSALRALWRSSAVRLALATLVPVGAFAVWWVVAEHALDLVPDGIPVAPHQTSAHVLALVFGFTGPWLQEMVGVLGSLDTFLPSGTYLAWYALIGLLVLAALATSRRRQGAALVLLVVAVVAAPALIVFDQVHRLGIDWQGRYTLPLAVGVPLLAAALLDGALDRPATAAWGRLAARVRGRLATTMLVVLGVAEMAGFTENLRRFTVGVAGPLDLLVGRWQPPLGTAAVLVLAALAIAATLALLRALVTRPPLAAASPAAVRSIALGASSDPVPDVSQV